MTTSNTDENMKCRFCGIVGHQQKNCLDYQCQICLRHAPTHLSIYCPQHLGEPPFTLTWKDDGFYDALRRWEQYLINRRRRKAGRRARTVAEEEAAYMLGGSAADEDVANYDNYDPVYDNNRDV
jgi:hypothetical protein